MPDAAMPWLADSLAALDNSMASGRFPHALLVTGPEGVGKFTLARLLAARLLCAASGQDGNPCAQCQACVLYAAGNHPDYYEVLLPEDKSAIGIDQIRELSAKLTLTSNLGARRVAIVYPADLMTRSAANSLLKTLEEPPEGTVMVLVTARPARLPATVRSRCQKMQQARPSASLARDWLMARDPQVDWEPLLVLAGGAPLKALDLRKEGLDRLDAQLRADLKILASAAGSPLDIAKRWEKIGSIRCIEWMQASVQALAHAKAVGSTMPPDLQKVGENINLAHLLDYNVELAKARALLDTPANKLLVLENILIPWTRRLLTPDKWQQAGTL